MYLLSEYSNKLVDRRSRFKRNPFSTTNWFGNRYICIIYMFPLTKNKLITLVCNEIHLSSCYINLNLLNDDPGSSRRDNSGSSSSRLIVDTVVVQARVLS